MFGCQGPKKRAVAAAKIDPERRSSTKQLFEIELSCIQVRQQINHRKTMMQTRRRSSDAAIGEFAADLNRRRVFGSETQIQHHHRKTYVQPHVRSIVGDHSEKIRVTLNETQDCDQRVYEAEDFKEGS